MENGPVRRHFEGRERLARVVGSATSSSGNTQTMDAEEKVRVVSNLSKDLYDRGVSFHNVYVRLRQNTVSRYSTNRQLEVTWWSRGTT
jgi:hypothetical protein